MQLKEHGLSDLELVPVVEEKVAETLKSLYQYMKEWVGLPDVIGGSSFGYPQLRSASEELKVKRKFESMFH